MGISARLGAQQSYRVNISLKSVKWVSGAKIYRPGSWNKIRVEARGDRIRTWLNGAPRADLKDFMTAAGFIGLQVHSAGIQGMKVQWRNIRIQELKSGR